MSAPLDVVLERLSSRATNEFGKSVREREHIIRDFMEIEPLLRAGATNELDATRPRDEIVDELIRIAQTQRSGTPVGTARTVYDPQMGYVTFACAGAYGRMTTAVQKMPR